MAKAKKTEPVTPVEKSKAQKLVDFIKSEGITINHTYTVRVKADYANVVPQSVLDAIRLGFLEADIQMKVV